MSPRFPALRPALPLLLVLSVGCEELGGEPEVVPYTTADVRIDNSGPAEVAAPRMCVDGTTVYAVWHDDRRGGRNQVFFNAGRAGGSTWGEPVQLSADPTGTSVAENPDIVCAGGSVYVAWEDDRDSDLGHRSIYFRHSDDGGRTWEAELRLNQDEDGDWDSLGPRLGVDFDPDRDPNKHVYLVFYDNRRGAYDIYFNRSLNSGWNWLAAEQRLDTDGAGAAYSAQPMIVTDGIGGVYVAWQDSRHGSNDIYVRHSSSRGDLWDPTETRLTGGTPGQFDAFGVSMTIDKEAPQPSIYVVWHDDRNGGRDIFLSGSTNAGLSWQAEPTRVEGDGPGASDSFYPSVSARNRRVLVAWHDDRNVGFDILLRASEDGGGSWGAEFRVDTDVAGTAHSLRPVVDQEGDRVVVGWLDHRAPPEVGASSQPDVYYRLSTDGGIRWAGEDVRVDDDPQATAISDDLLVQLAGPVVHMLWVDYRLGNADLWYRGMPAFIQEGEE